MTKRIITDEEITKVILYINSYQTLKAKGILQNLEEQKKDTLREDLRRLVRNNGRSNMISKSEIEELLRE